MNFLKSSISFLFLGLISASAIAQKIKLIEGDLSPLKGETSVITEFTYDNMSVGKYDKEADYVAKKTEEYNKKEAGRGDSWAKSWVNDRTASFEPKFNQLFEKASEMAVTKNAKSAKYTIIFKTNSTEPGYNVGIMRGNAYINAEAWIVETAGKKVIAKISVLKVPGRTFGGYDFDTGGRIAECYADAGKSLGKFIKKKS